MPNEIKRVDECAVFARMDRFTMNKLERLVMKRRGLVGAGKNRTHKGSVIRDLINEAFERERPFCEGE